MSLLNNSNAISTGGDYNLENSLRFRSSASAYLSRTPTVAGNRKTWTMSMWVKRGNNAYQQMAFASESPTYADPICEIGFSSDNIDLFQYTSSFDFRLITTQVFRDPSAWYHIVWSVDTTQATASNRIKLYVNGVQVTAFTTATYPALNLDTAFNYTGPHLISARGAGGAVQEYFDGYMTEVNFVDGQALTASDFGETNEDTGVWQPIKYTGTYGTNGFYLPMNQTLEVYSADYLVVAGGGAGGYALYATNNAGGGGAGGYLTGTTNLAIGSTYTVTVGEGGSGLADPSTNGSNSVLSGTAITTITSVGGGFGGSNSLNSVGGSGGSSGGGGNNTAATGTATAGQGNIGGNGAGLPAYGGGGGGGAGAAGTNATTSVAGTGGGGLSSSITGTSITYAGGGGAGCASGYTPGTAGSGGGGAGSTTNGTAGTANTGGGGGGSGSSSGSTAGGAGGSGVVILRILTTNYTGTTTGSPTVTTDGSYKVVKFTASGSYTA